MMAYKINIFFKENSLSIVLFLLFFIFLIGLGLTGLVYENEELQKHGQPTISLGEYLISGNFGEAVFENWESEFLQMGALVILTIWLVQKGSADSKKLRGKESVDTSSRYSIIRAQSWRTRAKGVASFFYSNSLSLALFALFFISFILHGFSGLEAANQDALIHGQPTMSLGQYMASSQFWFESFQNWQSEFLAVAALIVLQIYLRQRHSPESKPVSASNKKTGS